VARKFPGKTNFLIEVFPFSRPLEVPFASTAKLLAIRCASKFPSLPFRSRLMQLPLERIFRKPANFFPES
jgi:hypothetical protein